MKYMTEILDFTAFLFLVCLKLVQYSLAVTSEIKQLFD